ncbi:MAG: MFS transporter [Bacteroidota bacterium]|nr:MFS transporter [Bacteroidota bacterium]MDP3145193.1 MFS transporter [Bacteroidota bacterium]MDP3557281.1 MFS transporter [Bacteroidota bacterium]
MSFFRTESLQIFKIKEFRLFVLARFFLTLAVQMQFSTIYLQVYYEYSKEELMLGLIGLTEALPFVVASFFSGHVSDNFFRKRIILIGMFALLIGAVLLYLNSEPLVYLLKNAGVLALFAVVFLFGIIRSFLAATLQPYLSQIVPRQFYTHSATWNSTAWHTGAILGPVIAGLIYGYNNQLNAKWCHLIEVILFLLALSFIWRINHKGAPEKQDKKESVLEGIKVGLNFVFKNKMVLSALSLDLFAVLFGGAVALIPAFTDKVLHMGPEAYGLLRTAPAIGAVLMALVMVFYPPAKKAGLALIWSVVAFGIFTILFALSTTYFMAFAMLFFTGAFDNVSVVVRHSILQLMTPDNMRGRVSAINSVFIGSSNEIGAFESGSTAKLFGLIPSIIVGGGLTIFVVAVINKLNPKLKKLDINRLQ